MPEPHQPYTASLSRGGIGEVIPIWQTVRYSSYVKAFFSLFK